MLEPSDNGITFEGLIDALMVSLNLALHSSSIEPEQILYIELAHGINSTTGFVRRVQSSKVEEQKPTDFCLHFNFPGRVAQISVDQGSFFLCRMLFTLLPS